MSNKQLSAARRTGRADRGTHLAPRLRRGHRSANRAATRGRHADELRTEELALELAHAPDAAPLTGRITAALGAGARRMARDTNAEPDPGPGAGAEPGTSGESQ